MLVTFTHSCKHTHSIIKMKVIQLHTKQNLTNSLRYISIFHLYTLVHYQTPLSSFTIFYCTQKVPCLLANIPVACCCQQFPRLTTSLL